MKLNTYLNFNGQCEEAFKFYEKCLNGKILMLMTHGDSPMAESIGPEWRDKIMHASLAAAGTTLMGADMPPQHQRQPQGFSVSLSVATAAEAETLFKGLSDGGQIHMPLEKTFWSEAFGMFVDRFGIPWMVNCDPAA